MNVRIAGLVLLGVWGSLSGCREKTLFSGLPASETGVTFANRITENDSINVLDFEYVYNGGGVAIGDFNNDGLQDLYFTGNQVPNRLYLNRGKMRFEDITERAGATGTGRWCSGVALVDINADGLLDIYVGATVPPRFDPACESAVRQSGRWCRRRPDVPRTGRRIRCG
jgi:hypothetical protein